MPDLIVPGGGPQIDVLRCQRCDKLVDHRTLVGASWLCRPCVLEVGGYGSSGLAAAYVLSDAAIDEENRRRGGDPEQYGVLDLNEHVNRLRAYLEGLSRNSKVDAAIRLQIKQVLRGPGA